MESCFAFFFQINFHHTFVEDDFVAKDLDVEFPVCKKTIQDVSTGLASGLYI